MPERARARTRVLIAACLVLALVGSALVLWRGPADDVVLEVNGWTLGRAELRDQLDQIAANPGYRAARGRNGQPLAVFRGGSTTDYDPTLVVEMLNERVTFQLAAAEVARRGLVITDADRSAAVAVIEDGLASGTAPAGPSPTSSVPPAPSVPPGTDGRAVLDAFGSYRQVLIDGVVNLQLLQRALGLGTGVSDDEAARVLYERTREQISMQACVRHVLVRAGAAPTTPGGSVPPPSEADLTAARDRALGLKARLDAGEDLAALAATTSDDRSSRPRGGDLGCVPKGRYEGEFEQAAWTQPVGQVGEPVRSTFGYHLLVVYERRERTYEELLPSLRAAVRDQGQAALQQWLRDASRRATVAVDPGIGRWNASSGLVELPGTATIGLDPRTPSTAPGGTR